MTTPEDPFNPPPGSTPPPPPPGYGQPAAPPPGYGAMPELASWGLRVQSAFIDWFGPSLIAGLIYRGSTGLGALLYLAALAWALYNAYQAGQTGQSTGKKIAGTRLLRAQDGQVVGGGLGIGRYFLHILDALPCYLGFLWPLWDAKKQTFADKILSTVVVKA
ncbi:MAG: RDD family protein [Mycobacteriales bacterium]